MSLLPVGIAMWLWLPCVRRWSWRCVSAGLGRHLPLLPPNNVASMFRVVHRAGANCWRGVRVCLVVWLYLLHLLLLLHVL